MSRGGTAILLADRYEIEEKLGEGRFGKVYKVRDLKENGKIYVLKISKDANLNNYLLDEAQSVIFLNHPNLVKLHKYIVSRKRNEVYLIYEFCDGGDLKNYVEKKGKLELKEALNILKQIADGLAYLHKKCYIHSDIKPENVLAKREGNRIVWKLGDFSLIKSRGYSGILDVKGTVGYIAPEVFKGKIHRSSDIFSLGCMFYYTLKGKHPFAAEDPKEELAKNKLGKVEIPKELPEDIRKIFKKMVALNYSERYRTAEELLRDLRKLGV
jgi:serine/threonine protein kinase